MSSGLDQPCAQRAVQKQQTFRQGKPAPGPGALETADEDSFTSAESTEAAGPVETWLPRRYYSCPDGSGWKLRGATYLDDRKKIPAGDPAFSLEGVEVCTTAEADLRHIAQYLPVVMHSKKAYQIVVHFMMPYGGNNMHLAIVFASASLPPESEAETDPFAVALGRFVAGDGPEHDARRDKTFKLIPKVAEGAWVVRQAVGSTPCIIGTKLATTYHRGRNPPYLEVSVDINSNTAAASITSFVGGYMNSLNIHLAFLLEGKTPAELPEQLLGTVALDHVELQEAKALDTSAPLVPL